MTGALLQDGALDWTHVPYRGGAPAITDLLAGQLDLVLINVGAVAEHIRAGRLHGVGVTSEARLEALPTVPTLAEQGLGGFDVVGWHGLVAPAGTDPVIVARINRAVTRASTTAPLRLRLVGLGFEPVDAGPDALAELMRSDVPRFRALVERSGARPD